MTPAERWATTKRLRRRPRNLAVLRNTVWWCRLREYREAAGVSLHDTAAALGMSVAGIHQIEHGSDPMLTTARRLAQFFGCAEGDLWPEMS